MSTADFQAKRIGAMDAEANRVPRCRQCTTKLVIDDPKCPGCGEPNPNADAVYRFRRNRREQRERRLAMAQQHTKPDQKSRG